MDYMILLISRMIADKGVKVLPPKGLDGCYLGSIIIKKFMQVETHLLVIERPYLFQDFIDETMYILTNER